MSSRSSGSVDPRSVVASSASGNTGASCGSAKSAARNATQKARSCGACAALEPLASSSSTAAIQARGPGRREEAGAPALPRELLNGHDDLAAGMPFFEVPERIRGLVEGVGPVDHRGELTGLHQLGQRAEIVRVEIGKDHGELPTREVR